VGWGTLGRNGSGVNGLIRCLVEYIEVGMYFVRTLLNRECHLVLCLENFQAFDSLALIALKPHQDFRTDLFCYRLDTTLVGTIESFR
jgi:hypothetical protein